MDLITTIEDLAKTVGTDIATFADTEFHAFLTASLPLYDDLKAFAKSTGKTDLKALLADLKQDLVTGVEATVASGGNIGAAVAAVATETASQVEGQLAQDAKNALYGGLAIVAADIPQIAGTAQSTPSTICSDRETGQSRGFAFVELAEGAEEAIQALHQAQFGGRNLTVNEAKPREDRPSTRSGYSRSY